MARPGVEAAVEAAAEAAAKGGMVFFEAPTGYGKTTATPLLYRRTVEGGLAPRIVHALPLRAIVEQAYKRFNEELGGVAGYQAGGLGLEGKAPFYGPPLVVSTLDSLVLTVGRWSLGEPWRMGHYEVARAHVLSGVVVLDEAHLPFQPDPFSPASREPSRAASVMAALAYALAFYRVPVLVETATLPEAVYRAIADRASHAGRESYRVRRIVVDSETRAPSGAEVIWDEDYFGAVRQIEWSYHSLPGLAEAVEAAAEAAEEGLRVFFAATRVRDAVAAYEALSERLGGGVALVHGRLALADREKVVEEIDRGEVSVLVGTSAVEAGVDFDSDVLLSDVPGAGKDWIAWESLFQRLGRVARRPGARRARVYLYGEGAEEAVKALQGVNPRIPSTYRSLLDSRGRVEVDACLMKSYLELATALLSSREVSRLREKLCNPLRKTMLVKAVALDEPVEKDSRGVEKVLSLVETGMVLTLSLPGSKEPPSWLYTVDGKVAVLVSEWRGARGHPAEKTLRIALIEYGRLRGAAESCGSIQDQGGSVILEALLVKPGAYKPGVGLA